MGNEMKKTMLFGILFMICIGAQCSTLLYNIVSIREDMRKLTLSHVALICKDSSDTDKCVHDFMRIFKVGDIK